MEGNKRYNRSENKLITDFIGILCILLMVQKTGLKTYLFQANERQQKFADVKIKKNIS